MLYIELQAREYELKQRSLRITHQIEKDLKPQLKNLRNEISKYENLIRFQTRFEEVSLQLERVRREIEERKTLEFPEANYDPLAHIPADFWASMSTRLLDTLGACAYPNLKEARYSSQTFDAFVNGKSKRIQGKGYRSFINTAVMLSLREYFTQEAKHDPGLLIIDTPLLGLDDPQMDIESDEIRETIPLALYEHLAGMHNKGQIIIIDNTKFMPDLANIKEECNLIQFTKQQDSGRYGFIPDATDTDLTDEGSTEHDKH